MTYKNPFVFRVAKRDTLLFQVLCGFYAKSFETEWKRPEESIISVWFRDPEKDYRSVMDYCATNEIDIARLGA